MADAPFQFSPEQFDRIMNELVAEYAPRVFAVVQEYGERQDGRIAAWGMAFDERAEVVDTEHRCRMGLCSPDSALRFYGAGERVTAHLRWV